MRSSRPLRRPRDDGARDQDAPEAPFVEAGSAAAHDPQSSHSSRTGLPPGPCRDQIDLVEPNALSRRTPAGLGWPVYTSGRFAAHTAQSNPPGWRRSSRGYCPIPPGGGHRGIRLEGHPGPYTKTDHANQVANSSHRGQQWRPVPATYAAVSRIPAAGNRSPAAGNRGRRVMHQQSGGQGQECRYDAHPVVSLKRPGRTKMPGPRKKRRGIWSTCRWRSPSPRAAGEERHEGQGARPARQAERGKHEAAGRNSSTLRKALATWKRAKRSWV